MQRGKTVVMLLVMENKVKCRLGYTHVLGFGTNTKILQCHSIFCCV